MKSDRSIFPVIKSQPVVERSSLFDSLFIALLLLISLAVPVIINKFGILAFVAILGLLTFVGIILAPELGLLAFVWITYTQFSDLAIVHYNLPSIAQILALVMTLVILIRITFYGEQPLGWMRTAPIFVVFMVNLIVSTLHAVDYSIASTVLINNVKRILGTLIVVYFIRSHLTFRRVIWVLIAAGIVMGTISAFQQLTGTFGNSYGGFGKWLIAEDNNSITRHRLTGPYHDPNAYAQILVFIVPLALDRFFNERRNILRLIAGWAAVVCTITVFFTFSRGNGLLNLLFTVALFLILRKMDLIPLLITAALGLVLLQYLPDTYSARIGSLTQIFSSNSGQISDQSFRSRLNENTAAYRMFLHDPLLGVGLGNFSSQYPTYAPQSGYNASSGPVSAPSLYAEIISEQGLLGMSIFVILMIIVFRDLLLSKKRFEDLGLTDSAYMASAFLAAMAGYMFSGFFKQSAYSNVFWVLVGIAIAADQISRSVSSMENEESISPMKQGV